MKNRKSLRTLCAIVAALLLCVCFPIAANAANDDGTETYTVTYTDGAGGFLFPEDRHYNLPLGIITPDFEGTIPTFEGMFFAGWEPSPDETVTRDVTYVASWLTADLNTSTAYTVVYTDGVDGEEVFKDQINTALVPGADTPAFSGSEPTRDGYKFVCWEPEVAEKVRASAVYTAKWEKKTPSETPSETPSGSANPPSGTPTPTPSQGTVYYPNYDWTHTPAPTALPAAGEDVSPKTGTSEVSLIVLAIVALAAAALMVGTMRKRAE